MFCPKCGNADQQPESYCRKCGVYLPDLSLTGKKKQTPQDHVRANMVLNGMTIVAAFTLAILNYLFLAFRPGTHPMVYVTAGVLLAIGCWHVQTLWRSILLRRQLKRPEPGLLSPALNDRSRNELESADGFVPAPASVTERTTRHLETTPVSSTKTQH